VRLSFALSPPGQAFHAREAEGKLAFKTALRASIGHDDGAAFCRIPDIGAECQPTTARAGNRDHEQADNAGDVLLADRECAESELFTFFQKLAVISACSRAALPYE
jgi:hypothetical protein